MALTIENLGKRFDGRPVLDGIDLEIGADEFVCLLGPSGCGKTTLLRIVAGLLQADEGRISLDGRTLAGISARERNFGMVFQSYSLFGHMTVAENVAYGLRLRRWSRDAMATRVATLLDMVRLPGMASRYPAQLSGGQQQRVAIARALAVEPALLLLDEPFSALDVHVRGALRDELRDMQRRLGVPTLMVTHDQEEAMTLADRIVCMNAGRIEQAGTPAALYRHPRSRFVATFMGQGNLLPAAAACALPGVAVPDALDARDLDLYVRPESLALSHAPDGEGCIRSVTFLGGLQRVHLDWRGLRLTADVFGGTEFAAGETVNVRLTDFERCTWFGGEPVADDAAAGATA
ncbi:ABC transporter ATP-binding protein [Chitinasiproducens palmae]|uniref:Iron(III) transport system ATP-binding protein n=1 Tax=Chitinasiproducens palmae TaxID=1770053 RepID=A0A1H2PMP5_9BURK|nr:ABC transporter ATP-binding protein [Chitinasiproducens palmae]SDV47349.1 iron(III) transport system ATP-binding protein [Chitinasiproducens palmae]